MDYNKYSSIWQSKKSSSTHYAHIYLEKPAIKKILENRQFENILDLGCGSGEDITWLKNLGEVTGFDSSSELIELAKFEHPDNTFIVHDLNNEIVLDQQYDLIYSSLTFHYIQDWDKLFKNLNKLLKPKGSIIFSTHHPIKWGSQTTKTKESNQFLMGYKKIKNENKTYEIYGDYLNQYKIEEKLFQQLDITHYNRPLSEMFRVFKTAGFQVREFIEPKPIEVAKTKLPDFYEVHSKIPLFVIWEIKKV